MKLKGQFGKKRIDWVINAALVLLILFVGYQWLKTGEGNYGKAPDAIFYTLDNQKVKLKDFKNKIVVVNFWFVGCPPCRLEIPLLNGLVTKYDTSRVVFLAVNVQDSPEVIRSFLGKNTFQYAQFVYGQTLYYKIAPNENKVPLNAVIDANGNVIFLKAGFTPVIAQNLEAIVSKYLKP